ncbi:MAG TPA: glycosyl hydrolase family 79 C-terminal domain-containing protein [Opitutaceae bacterium]|jgi:hypothetical protein|nr:glycosyl hydrolase family 79 C-terminal domain-containing protein [Opitutaceae bacterium]
MKTKSRTGRLLLLGFSLVLGLSTATLRAQSPVALQVDIAHPGRAVPSDFCGLSYEIKLVLPQETTLNHYFSPDNRPLINTFKTLGVKNLRVGGNTAERVTVAIPDAPDIDSFFAFAQAAGVKVIYTVRMFGNTTAKAAGIAKYVMDHYRDSVSCFTVGNEPDKPWKYPAYIEEWKKFTAAILASDCAPDAKFCGPSARHQTVEFARFFANDMGGWDHLAYVTQHFYPRGDGDKITDPAEERRLLLSPNLYLAYQKLYDAFVPAAKAKGIGYRLEETNSYGRGGAVGASDTFTASLWSVDYLYWWAWHDALGINFHSGQKEPRGGPATNPPNVYTPLTAVPKGIKVLPVGYGMKLFDLGSHGRLVPVSVVSNPDNLNLAVYGTIDSAGTLYLTVLNKEFGAKGRPAKLVINSGLPGAHGKIIFMSAPAGDTTAIEGITIGGAGIKEDGSWSGKWSDLPDVSSDGSVTVIVPAASAAVIELQGK